MKNRKGSTLMLTLIVFVFLSILATSTVSFMVSENKQSVSHKDGIEAYYIARSGAEATEAAILKYYHEEKKLNKKLSLLEEENGKNKNRIKEIELKLEKIEYEINKIEDIKIGGPDKTIHLDFTDKEGSTNPDFDAGKNPEVFIRKEKGDLLVIESTAKVGKNSKTVEKVMSKDKITDSGISKFEYPIYASGKLELEKGVKVETKPKTEIAYGDELKFKGNNMEIDIPGGVKKVEANDFFYPPVKIDMSELDSIETDIIKKLDKIRRELEKVKGEFKNNYKKITLDQLFGDDSFEFEDGGNYYIDGDLTDKNYEDRKDPLIIGREGKTINVYVKEKVEFKNIQEVKIYGNMYSGDKVEIKNKNNIEIKGSIYSNKKVEIKSEKNIEIEGSIYSDEDIEIKSKKGNITIQNSKFTSNKDVKIGIKNDDGSDVKGTIEIISSTIISKGQVEIEIENKNKYNGDIEGQIKIKNSIIMSNDDVEIEIESKNKESKKSKAEIKIINSILKSKEIEIEIEDVEGDIRIEDSEIKAKEKIEIEIEDAKGDITIIKSGLWADEEIELEAKKGNITIDGPIYAPNAEIEIEAKEFTMDNGVIIGKDVKLEKGSFIINRGDFDGTNIPFDPSDTSDINKTDRFKPGYYR